MMEATIVGLLPLQLGRLLVWGEALPIHVMVYGRFERGRPRSGRSRVRFVLFWFCLGLHALENRTGMADERGAFDGGQPGEWTPSAGPAPGAGWAPIGGTQGRAYSPYQHGGTSPPFQGSGALPAHISRFSA